MENIFRMPYGCFEQTSSTTYPNVLALSYMKSNSLLIPKIEMKAREYVNKGYQRLLTFEVDGGGFSWYGNAPAKLVLTAYGLMEFKDMAKVQYVDPELIKRTTKWLFDNQKANGSWSLGGNEKQDSNKTHNDLNTTAYITWAVAGSGDNGSNNIENAVKYINEHVKEVDDSYTLALCANALINCGKNADTVIKKLMSNIVIKEDSAHWESTKVGLMFSRGYTLNIETTAIAVQALAQINKFNPEIAKCLNWLFKQEDKRGIWHSTQATIQVLKALIATGLDTKTGTFDLDILVNGEKVKTLSFNDENKNVMRILSLSNYINSKNIILSPSKKCKVPYQLVYSYYTPWDQKVSPAKSLDIKAKYTPTKLSIKDLLTCNITVQNILHEDANMVIIDFGIPIGFDVVTQGLESMVNKNIINRYSVKNQQLIIYLKKLSPVQKILFTIQLKPKYPITTKTFPITIYQYYQPENRYSTLPIAIEVKR